MGEMTGEMTGMARRRGRWARLLVAPLFASCAVVAAAAFAPRAAAQVPFPEETDFHNTTYVGDEPEPARLAFYRAQEHLLGERFKECAGFAHHNCIS